MSSCRILLSCFSIAACLAVPSVAAASPAFPAEIQRALDTPCLPQCTVCHTTNLGGYGTALTAFAAAMVSTGGLRPQEPSTVAPALDALAEALTDSDGDGIPDVDELKQGFNPNGDGVELCSEVGYGCARVAPRGRPENLVLVLVAAGLVWASRRRARRAGDR